MSMGRMKRYYAEQTLESIARKVLTAYDSTLYYGDPAPIPIEAIIEAHGLDLEYQYLRKNGRILGETIFHDRLAAIYDWDNYTYTFISVRAGTILIDASLCEENICTGRLRFTCAHELAHWILHKHLYLGTGEHAALMSSVRESDMEVQANILGAILLLPMPQVKRCFYRLHGGRTTRELIDDMAALFQVSKQTMRIRLESHNLI